MKRRLLSILLVCVMLVGVLSLPTLATGSSTSLTWKDSYLDGPTTVYNEDLAFFSLAALTLGTSGESSLTSAMKDADFSYVKTLGHGTATDGVYPTSTYIYNKTISDEETLYAIVICVNEELAFLNDFDFMGSLSFEYAHFQAASSITEDILSELEAQGLCDEYLSPVNDNSKFLITGHGRGGAAAGYLGNSLVQCFGPEKVSVYTFGSYNYYPVPEADKSSYYYNIFNIENPEDLMTYFPTNLMGFDKYGQQLKLNVKSASADVATKYKNYSGQNFYSFNDNGTAVQEFIGVINQLAPSVSAYYNTKYNAYYDVQMVSTVTTALKTPPTRRDSVTSLTVLGFLNELTKLYDDMMAIKAELDQKSMIEFGLNLMSNFSDYKPILEKYYELKYLCELGEDEAQNFPLKPIAEFAVIRFFGMDPQSLPDIEVNLTEVLGGNTSSVSELVNIFTNLHPHEGLVATTLEAYRAYMDAGTAFSTNPAEGGKTLSDDCARVTGAGVFDDMTLSCKYTQKSDLESTYELQMYAPAYDYYEPINANGTVTVSLKLPQYDPLIAYSVYDGETEIEGASASDGYISFETDKLGTYRVVGAIDETVFNISKPNNGKVTVTINNKTDKTYNYVVAAYDGNKMTNVLYLTNGDNFSDVGYSKEHTFDEAVDRVKLMFLDSNGVPVRDAIEASTAVNN